MARAFIDTNVFFYSVDVREPVKQNRAQELLRSLGSSGEGSISPQIVNEFASNIMKKLGATPVEAESICSRLHGFALIPSTMDSLTRALQLMGGTSISFWDALAVSSAIQGGCRVMYTEDLNHGQVVGGVRIVNPFL